MDRFSVWTTGAVNAWMITPDGQHYYMGVCQIDNVNISRKTFTLSGMAGTSAGKAVYGLPDNGFDIEFRWSQWGFRDRYDHTDLIGKAEVCRVTERTASPLALYVEDNYVEFRADLACESLQFFPKE